jgi:hypothetical protein
MPCRPLTVQPAVVAYARASAAQRPALAANLVGLPVFTWWDLYGWSLGEVDSYRRSDCTFRARDASGHLYRVRGLAPPARSRAASTCRLCP